MAIKYKIYTLGCKVNQYDSGRLAAELERAGMVAARQGADLAFINSCAVTKTAIIKSGRAVKLAKKENPKAKIVLAGCWIRVDKVELADVDYVAGENDIMKLVNKITNYELPPFAKASEDKRITNKIQNENNKINNNKLANQAEHSRYFIKIQDGCEQHCSYCVIPYTRGKLKSRGEAEVINEIKQAVASGYGEIVLSGIHLGLYGGKSRGKQSLAHNKNNLTRLLKKIIKISGLGRVRLSSIEVTEVTPELIKLMMKNGKICRHLHLPLQAGNDKILKLMNRPYSIKNYELRIKKIRKAMPDIAISTDVITGFPGETEKDFKATINFIKQINFSRLHVFPFSAHAITPAAKMPGQVNEKEKIRRAKILRELGVKLAESYKKKFIGQDLEIVVEQIRPDKIIGKTQYYFDFQAEKEKITDKSLAAGQIIKIKN